MPREIIWKFNNCIDSNFLFVCEWHLIFNFKWHGFAFHGYVFQNKIIKMQNTAFDAYFSFQRLIALRELTDMSTFKLCTISFICKPYCYRINHVGIEMHFFSGNCITSFVTILLKLQKTFTNIILYTSITKMTKNISLYFALDIGNSFLSDVWNVLHVSYKSYSKPFYGNEWHTRKYVNPSIK